MKKHINYSIKFLFITGLVLFLAGCASLSGKPSEKATKDLFVAVSNQDVEAAEIAIKNGADVNAQNIENKGRTPLIMAVSNDDMPMIELLLSKKADVNKGDWKKFTPLIYAATNGNKEIVVFLIDKKADINATDDYKATALYRAVRSDADTQVRIEIINIFLENGADINVQLKGGETVVLAAAVENNVELLNYLIDKGADPSIIPPSDDGKTLSETLAGVDKDKYADVLDILKKNGAQ